MGYRLQDRQRRLLTGIMSAVLVFSAELMTTTIGASAAERNTPTREKTENITCPHCGGATVCDCGSCAVVHDGVVSKGICQVCKGMGIVHGVKHETTQLQSLDSDAHTYETAEGLASKEPRIWHASLKAGLSLGSFRGEYADTWDGTRGGFYVGALVSTFLSSHLGVALEGSYVPKGAEGAVLEDPEGDIKVRFEFDYIQFSALGMLRFAEDEDVTLVLLAGPTVAFNISAEAKVEGSSPFGPIDATESLADHTRAVDLGALLAVEMKFKEKEPAWSVGFAYNPSILTVIDGADTWMNTLLIYGAFSWNVSD